MTTQPDQDHSELDINAKQEKIQPKLATGLATSQDIEKPLDLNLVDHGELPFQQSSDDKIRVFSPDISDGELKWHWDEESRFVKIIDGIGWRIQIDNHLPIDLVPGEMFFIQKGAWHRIIKGKTKLVVEITKMKE
jgi:hypothetical protein